MPLARPTARPSRRRVLALAAVAASAPLLARCTRTPERGPDRVWGVTLDNVWNTDATVDALARLPARPTARVVLDVGPAPSDYAGPVTAVHAVANVMGTLVDSSRVADLDVEAYAARAEAFLDALGGAVDVWEIGNEVNGHWTGESEAVAAKVRAAYDAVKARGGRVAVTLFLDEGCPATTRRDAFRWASQHLSPKLRAGVDQAWLSFYEEECPGARPDWQAAFDRLGELFPSATLGIGECGARREEDKHPTLLRCYGVALDHPRFVGGGFWWYFSEDMVPASKPLWAALAELMAKRNGGKPPRQRR